MLTYNVSKSEPEYEWIKIDKLILNTNSTLLCKMIWSRGKEVEAYKTDEETEAGMRESQNYKGSKV